MSRTPTDRDAAAALGMSPRAWAQMHGATREVLEYVKTHPGCTRKEVAAALPDNTGVRHAFISLVNAGYLKSDSGRGRECHYTASLTERHVSQVATAPLQGQSVASSRWTEPYLSDVGVRKDGLQYRDCPSRRGSRLVYCYRRPA